MGKIRTAGRKRKNNEERNEIHMKTKNWLLYLNTTTNEIKKSNLKNPFLGFLGLEELKS